MCRPPEPQELISDLVCLGMFLGERSLASPVLCTRYLKEMSSLVRGSTAVVGD